MAMNVITKEGAIETRGGTSKLNTSSVGTFACHGFYTRHDNSGAETMVAWFNGTLYGLGVTTFATVPSAQSIYTAGVQVYASEYENYMFFGNGSNTPYKYGGGTTPTFTRHGVPAPSTTLTAGTAPTGTGLTGDFQYLVTYVNSNLVEGDVSARSATLTAANENIRLTSIPVAPQSFGVNQRYIYRTEAGGTTFKRVTTLNDNTTTTYDDATPDASLGVSAPSDQGEPPNYSAIVYHQARLFVISPSDNLVWYSEIGNPYVFKATSFLRAGDNTVDTPVGLAIYDNSLVITCRENPWILYMPTTDPADWSLQRIRSNYGSRSPFSMFKFSNKLMFGAVQESKFVGFAALEGQTVSPSASLLTSSALGSELQSDKIEPDMFDVQESYMQNISSIVYQNRAYVALTKGDAQTTNNRVYVFDFALGNLSKKQKYSWTPWSGLSPAHFTVYNGKLYYATAEATGFVYEMNTSTYSDDGVAIDSYVWTKEFSGLPGEENVHKDFRYMQLFYEKSGDYFMNIRYRVDSDSGDGNVAQLNLDPGGSLWGTMRWGLDLWGGGSDEGESRVYVAPARGKRIQFRFSNQNAVGQKFKVVGFNYFYNVKGLR
jgi:hypothetical protein